MFFRIRKLGIAPLLSTMTTDSTPSKLPAEFQRSYNDFRKYPSNLVTKTTFAAASTSIRQRLDRHENDLLLEKDNAVLFRDFNGEGEFFDIVDPIA